VCTDTPGRNGAVGIELHRDSVSVYIEIPPTLQSGAIGVNQIPRPPLADTPFWKGGEKRVAIYVQAGRRGSVIGCIDTPDVDSRGLLGLNPCLQGSVSVYNESPGGAEGIPKVG